MASVQVAAARSDRLVLGFDLAATFLFGLEGASSAVAGDLDLFGVLVLGFVTAVGGGIIRDLLIGDVPPAAFRLQRYIVVALLGAAIAFVIFTPISHVATWVLITLDAAGLSLFTVSGASKALLFETNALTAIILGVVTGTGGGVIRDVLLNKVPAILRVDVYASAALLGAVVMTIGVRQGHSRGRMMFIGGGVCFALRLVAAWQHWGLPRAGAL
jgi:uncharacterized membrane protein YeiH